MTEDENEIALKAAIEDFINQSVTQGVTVAEAKAMARQAIGLASVRTNSRRTAAELQDRKQAMRHLSMTPRAIREREAKERARIESRCLDCKEETTFRADKEDEWYMVHNALWLQAHPDGNGKLCIGCLERRLGRRLRPEDFTDAIINTPGRSNSKRLNSRLLA